MIMLLNEKKKIIKKKKMRSEGAVLSALSPDHLLD